MSRVTMAVTVGRNDLQEYIQGFQQLYQNGKYFECYSGFETKSKYKGKVFFNL